MSTFPENVIRLPEVGCAAMGGTLAAVICGAEPGVPPRGVVRTTYDGGSAVPLRRRFQTKSIAWLK